MILDKETEEKYGYSSSDLTEFSTFKILVKCDFCGEITEKPKKYVILGRRKIQRDVCSNSTCRAKKGYESMRNKKQNILLFENENWLKEEYLNKRTPLRKMAKLANCNHKTIVIYLKKFNIRRGDESKQFYKSTPLADRDWLYKKYFEEKLSCPDIAKLLNVGYWNVANAMKRFGFKSRSCVEGRIIALEKLKK